MTNLMVTKTAPKMNYHQCLFIHDSFIPKHYHKYVELNVRYNDGCKKYSLGIPYFLRDRPK